MTLALNALIILWPLFVSLMARMFHRKQNSSKAWTGGPISWPKSFWLSYTVLTWFILPFLFLLHPETPSFLKIYFIAHLISWWIRGPLELIMIYKWFCWTPRYGIGHDLFHISLCLSILLSHIQEFKGLLQAPLFAQWGGIFSLMILFTTVAEILFAVLFLKFRSSHEAKENVYFASKDPKWKLINRVTLTVVIIAMSHLGLQSLFLGKSLLDQ